MRPHLTYLKCGKLAGVMTRLLGYLYPSLFRRAIKTRGSVNIVTQAHNLA